MANPFTKSAGQSAGDMARKIAKQVVSEPLEIGKNIKSQLVGPENASSESQEVQANNVQSHTPEINAEEINANAKMRLIDLQGEVQRLIEERKKLSEKWASEQDEKMGVNLNETNDKKILVQPSSIRSRGAMSPGKGKQGTKEIGKGPSG